MNGEDWRMRGTPPHTSKDDYFDEDDGYETNHTQRYSNERQQKMNNLDNEYHDEHPERPKIKRASRNSNPELDSSQSTPADRRPRLDKPRTSSRAAENQSTRRSPDLREQAQRKDPPTRRGSQDPDNERQNPPTVRRRPKVYIEDPPEDPTTRKRPGTDANTGSNTTRRLKPSLSDERADTPRATRRPRIAIDDETLSSPTAIRRPKVSIDDEPLNKSSSPRRSRAPIDDATLSRATSPRRPRIAIDDEPLDNATLNRTAGPRRPKVYIEEPPEEQKRYTFVYNLPTVQESRERVNRRTRHSQQMLFDQWQMLLNNRPLSIIIVSILIIIVLIPLSINLFAHPSSSTQIVKDTTVGSTSQPTKVPQANGQSLVITPPNNNHPAPPLLATSGYLIDANTGTTLYAKNPFMHISPMSTTKLMTVLLAVQHGNLDQNITINAAITKDLQDDLSADSALMGIKPGEIYTERQLLYGLLLVSGNDAAIAIADTVAGNVPKFADEMNQKAKQLGMTNTHFMNPHGLIEAGHYSSAHDLALLGAASLTNPIVQQISGTKFYTIAKTNHHAEHDMENENQFMFWYPGVLAGKTGWDNAANFLQVVLCKRNNHLLIGVVMHTDDWWTDMRDLMNYGFSTFTWISPREINANQYAIPYASEWTYFQIDKRERTLPTGDQGRFYIFTEYEISGSIMTYFDKNKGLAKFGYPIGPVTITNSTLLNQRFQNATIQCNQQTKQCKTI
jgi:D-alanyl-D-alanine carboxypeptidase